jgi:hypothetical protein
MAGEYYSATQNISYLNWLERNEGTLWGEFINDNNHLPFKINHDINMEFEDFCVEAYEQTLRDGVQC